MLWYPVLIPILGSVMQNTPKNNGATILSKTTLLTSSISTIWSRVCDLSRSLCWCLICASRTSPNQRTPTANDMSLAENCDTTESVCWLFASYGNCKRHCWPVIDTWALQEEGLGQHAPFSVMERSMSVVVYKYASPQGDSTECCLCCSSPPDDGNNNLHDRFFSQDGVISWATTREYGLRGLS